MDRYHEERVSDPDLSEKGILESLNIGLTFKEKNIKIDEIYTSAFRRNLHSSKLFKESYGNKDLKIKLMIKLHEKKGPYIKDKSFPGLKLSEVKEILPDIEIDENNLKMIDEEGWWKSEVLETTEQSIARVKEVIKELKDSYALNKGKTLLCFTHGGFLNDLLCTYTNNVQNASKDYFISSNNGITIMDFIERRDEYKQKDFIESHLVAFNVKIGGD